MVTRNDNCIALTLDLLNCMLPLMCNTRTKANTSTLNDADVVSDVVLRQTDRGAAGYGCSSARLRQKTLALVERLAPMGACSGGVLYSC